MRAITCAYPGCANITTIANSVYVDGCGQVCPECEDAHFGGRPSWVATIEPPL